MYLALLESPRCMSAGKVSEVIPSDQKGPGLGWILTHSRMIDIHLLAVRQGIAVSLNSENGDRLSGFPI